MKLKGVWRLLKATFAKLNEHKVPRLAAALAYYTMFSIAPVLIIVIAITGLVFGRTQTENQIVSSIRGMVGAQSASLVQSLIESASQPGRGLIATVVGILTTLLGSAGLFFQLKDALNTVWEVAPRPGYGILDMARDNLLSFAMVLGIGFLLLVSLVLSAAVAAVSTFLGSALPGSAILWQTVDFTISFALVAVLFAAIFKVLPDVQVPWSDVWRGAVLTALLFTIGKLALGLYIAKGNPGGAYGAAGSLVIILIWVNFATLILLFGAEFTRAYSLQYGSHARPEEYAVPVTEEERAREGIPSRQAVEQIARETVPSEGAAAVPPRRTRRWTTAALGAAIGVIGVFALEVAAVVVTLARTVRGSRGGGAAPG